MRKLVILEDEKNQAELLVKFLRTYETRHGGTKFTVEHYERATALLEQYQHDADILFLDIRLPDMLGIEVARRIRETDRNVIIFFVTNLAQYAIEGYSVQAFDYILKPVSYASFEAKLERASRILDHNKEGTLLHIKTKEGAVRLSASEISYIEIAGHNIGIHTIDHGVIKQWGTLSKFERELKEDNFVRCNSCYLVNLKYVQGVKGEYAIVNGEELAISMPRRKAFLQALALNKGGSR